MLSLVYFEMRTEMMRYNVKTPVLRDPTISLTGLYGEQWFHILGANDKGLENLSIHSQACFRSPEFIQTSHITHQNKQRDPSTCRQTVS